MCLEPLAAICHYHRRIVLATSALSFSFLLLSFFPFHLSGAALYLVVAEPFSRPRFLLAVRSSTVRVFLRPLFARIAKATRELVLVCSWRVVRACVYPRARSRFDMAKLRARDVFIDQIQQAVSRYGYLRAPVLSPAKLTESGQQRSLLLTDRPIDRPIDRPTDRPIDRAKVSRRKAAICGEKSCQRTPVRPRGSAVNHGTVGA